MLKRVIVIEDSLEELLAQHAALTARLNELSREQQRLRKQLLDLSELSDKLSRTLDDVLSLLASRGCKP